MGNIWIIACLIVCCLGSTLGSKDLKQLVYNFLKDETERRCGEGTTNCNDCLTNSYCTWCSNGIGAKCTPILQCPKESSTSDCGKLTPVLDTQKQDITEFFRQLDSSSKKADCTGRGNCSFCTSLPSCSWCEKINKCFPFDGSANATSLCGSTLWYRNQCLYKSTVKPCPQRTGGCEECTQDSLCFWCKSTSNCSYYPNDAHVPNDCPSGDFYYQKCTHMNFWVVLSPILAIILAPILIFIILGIVLWCMRKCCKNVDDEDSADEEDESSDGRPPPEKKSKMLMSHKPSPSRVEELRRKYNLEQ